MNQIKMVVLCENEMKSPSFQGPSSIVGYLIDSKTIPNMLMAGIGQKSAVKIGCQVI